MNQTPSTGTALNGSLNKPIPYGVASLRPAINGWVIERYGDTYIASTWNDAIAKLAEIFVIEQ